MDEEGNITSKRQHNATNVKQLGCIWACLCSFKSVGKRSLGIKIFILIIYAMLTNLLTSQSKLLYESPKYMLTKLTFVWSDGLGGI